MSILTFIRDHWKHAAILVLVCFVNIQMYWPHVSETVTVTKVESKSEQKQIDTKTKKTVVKKSIRSPDGTVTVETRTDSGSETRTSSTTQSLQSSTLGRSSYAGLTRYSLDLAVRPATLLKGGVDGYAPRLGFAARLGDLPIFGVVEAEPALGFGLSSYHLGVRYEW